jgi:chloride channel protein, CIC family
LHVEPWARYPEPCIPLPTKVQTGSSHLAHAVWAVVLGVVSSLACVGMRLALRGMQWVFTQQGGLLSDAAQHLSLTRRAMTPVLGALLALAVLWLARRYFHATPAREYVEAIHCEEGRIPLAPNVWRTLSSIFSLASGAAVGREGSMIQLAATAASWVGERSPVRGISLSRQVSYGVAAAVATAYQAPIAGIFFATEIVLEEMPWMELPFFALASVAGWLTSRWLLGAGPIFAVRVSLPALSREWLYLLPLAIVLGALGPLYQAILRSLRFAKKWPLALVWGGLVVGLLSLARTTVWGNGDAALLSMMQGKATQGILIVLALRLIATTFCVGTGTVGGVFTPTLFAGAAIGLVAGQMLHLSQPVLFAVFGLGCFLSAVTHAPWMASFMAVELTGEWHLLPVVIVCNLLASFVAHRISPRSLYAIASHEPLDSIAATHLGEHSGEHPSLQLRS